MNQAERVVSRVGGVNRRLLAAAVTIAVMVAFGVAVYFAHAEASGWSYDCNELSCGPRLLAFRVAQGTMMALWMPYAFVMAPVAMFLLLALALVRPGGDTDDSGSPPPAARSRQSGRNPGG